MLTCVSRFEHLHLIGEGAPTDAHFFSSQAGGGGGGGDRGEGEEEGASSRQPGQHPHAQHHSQLLPDGMDVRAARGAGANKKASGS